jgi:NAD(P)-dependent dehydrogenase (short-subunit alcohol dehydrogenase family)
VLRPLSPVAGHTVARVDGNVKSHPARQERRQEKRQDRLANPFRSGPVLRPCCRGRRRALRSRGATATPTVGARESEMELMVDLGIQGLRVLVTAGASGIGREVARAFVAEGAKVHVCDVDAVALQRLAGSDPQITRTQADVADREEVARLFTEAVSVLGGLDVLVNNAGVTGPTGGVDEIKPEDWDRCLAVNITGQFNCARLAVPHLRKSKNASLVNLSSAAGRLGFPLRAPYAASKWAVVGFSKSLAAELGPGGIRVNAIQPGIVEGDRIRRVFENKARARGISFAAMSEEALSVVSMKTMVTPQQIADAIVFICSQRGRTISGQALSICGDTQMLP